MTSTTTSRRTLLIAWLPTVIWCIVISVESTELFSGNHTASWLHRILASVFPHFALEKLELLNHLLRKTGHFIGYATLSWFAFRGWMETLAYQHERTLVRSGRPIMTERRWHLRAAVLAVLVTIAVAALDEFHQSFLPDRTGVFRDVVLDTSGGIFVQLLLLLYWTGRKKKRTSVSATRPKLKEISAS